MENNRGGTSIEELMRNSASSSDDDSVVNSILNEINQDKETQIKSQQDNQMMEQQKMLEHQHQQRQQQEMYEKQLMIQKQRQMENQKMMEQRRIFEQNKLKAEQENLLEKADSENTNRNKLFNEFKSSLIFFIIFILLNITQINSFICNSLSIENNNIFIVLKGFIATIIFFFMDKLINKYI